MTDIREITNRHVMDPHESTGPAAPSSEAPPSKPEVALPDLDEEVIGKWKAFLTPDKFDELVASQLEGAKGQVQRLAEAAKVGKLAEIGRVAHDVKGVCGNLGMTKVYRFADSLTQACRSEREQEARDLLQAIKQAMSAATAAFENRFINPCKGGSA